MKKEKLSPHFDLPPELRSIQPVPRHAIQKGQQTYSTLPLLELPSALTNPREGPSGQGACSAFLPAVERTIARAKFQEFGRQIRGEISAALRRVFALVELRLSASPRIP